MNRASVLLALLALTTSAVATAPHHHRRAAHPAPSAASRRGLAFAQAHCTPCHGIAANTISPNPESPPFEDIANRPGVTRETLRQFLRDSHNYPAAMNFTVEPANIGDLADYLVTLKRPGYRPAI